MGPPTRSGERGAAIVEFAVVLPLLLTLLFGIIEFGWAFGQQLDIKHGAREAARTVTVNYRPVGTTEDEVSGTLQTQLMVQQTCARMNFSDDVTVAITLPTGSLGETGQSVEIAVTAPLQTITGFFDNLLGSKTARSELTARVEVEASWAETTGMTCASVENVSVP